MEKTLFLDLIEGYYNTQLTRFQLQYFFSTNKYLAVSCPRRGGKSFIAQIDALYTCTTPDKRVVIILPNKASLNITREDLIDKTNALSGYIEVSNSNTSTICFNNGSVIHLLTASNAENDFIGCRFNKVIIEEPDYIKNIEDVIMRLEICMTFSPDAQIKLIGTHSINNHNLKSYMLNPYYEKISVTAKSIYSPMTNQQLEQLKREIQDDNVFYLQHLNEVTPSILNRLIK